MAEGETQRIEPISGIDDIRTMNQLMEVPDISSKGYQTLQDMKDRVITWSAGQVRMIAIKRRDVQIMLFFISVLLIALLSNRLLVRCYF